MAKEKALILLIIITITYIYYSGSSQRLPLISDHLTKILIGSSVSQIAVSESSRK